MNFGLKINKFLFVIDLFVKLVIIANESVWLEGNLRLQIGGVRVFDNFVDLLPLGVHLLSVMFVLLDCELLLLVSLHLKGLLERERVDLLEDGLESDEGLLKDFVPVVLSEIDDDGDEHGESLLLVSLEDGKEVVILKEAHSSVSDLQVSSSNASHYSSEKRSDEGLNLVNLTDFKHLL